MTTPSIVLNVPGDRDVRISQVEAMEIVARWLEQGEGSIIRAVDLSGRSWSTEASQVVSSFLSNRVSSAIITSVSLADCIAGLNAEEGRYVLALLTKPFASSKLIDINLRDNSLGWIGMGCIKPLFYGANRLQSLDLSNCGLGSDSMKLLKSIILADGGRIASSLTKIILDRNAIGPNGSKHVGAFLSQCRKLQTFSFAGCNAETSGTKRICQALLRITGGQDPLRRNSKLLHLDLSDNSIGRFDSDPIVPLCYAITNCKQLRYLNLSGGDLLPDGLMNVLTALVFSKTWLTDLNLESNSLGPAGARILSQYIQRRGACLQSLNLNSNELEDEGVCLLLEPFATASTNNCLEILCLDQNEIGPMGAKALRLARLDHLQLLSLEDNDEIPQQGLIETYGDRVSFGNTEAASFKLKVYTTRHDGLLSVEGNRHMPMNDLVAALEQTSYQVDDMLPQDKQEKVVSETIFTKAEKQSTSCKVDACVAQEKHEGAVLAADVPVQTEQHSQGDKKSDSISELFRKKEKSAKAPKRSDLVNPSVFAKQQHSSSVAEIAEFSKKVEERYGDWKVDTVSNEKTEVLPLTSPVDLGKPFSLAMTMKKKSEALKDSSVTELMAAIDLMTSLRTDTPPRGPKPKTQAATEPRKIIGKAGVTLSRSPCSKTMVELSPLKQRPSISNDSENYAQLGNTPRTMPNAKTKTTSDQARSPVMIFEPVFNPYAGKRLFDF